MIAGDIKNNGLRLFASSVPRAAIFKGLVEMSGNKVYEKVLDESRKSLRGCEFVVAACTNLVFPSLVSYIVAIGEEKTGQLDTDVRKGPDFYEKKSNQLSSRLSQV